MIVKFDSLNRFEVPQMHICNPGSVYNANGTVSNTIGILKDTSDEEIIFNFNAMSELNFRAYKVIYESPEENIDALKKYKSLQNRRVIFVDDIGFFVITQAIDGYSDGQDYKDISAKSCEIEIENKRVPYIENKTYAFTELLEMLVDILPRWTIGNIHSSIANKHRTFEEVADDKNILSFLMEDMQEAYECIFDFDIINRIINVYDQNDFVIQTPILFTKNDFINSLEITENSEDLYTSISVMGDENLNIVAVNPLGTNTIYNFDYYLSWMSDELSAKVSSWQQLIKDNFDSYYNLNLQYYDKLTVQNNYKFEMDKLNAQLVMYQRCRENIVAESGTNRVDGYNTIIVANGGNPIEVMEEIRDTLANIDNLIAETQDLYTDAKTKYDECEAELVIYRGEILAIQELVSFETYFTQEEYDELYNFIYEGSYQDEYITVTKSMTYTERFEQMKTLYDRATNQLNKISKPTQEFSIDLENFLFVKEFEELSKQLSTGSLINIELEFDDVAALFLSSISINYYDKSLSMTFGNRFNKFDPKSLFNNVLGDVKKSANSINYIKDVLYPITSGKYNELEETVNNSRTLTKNAALSSTNEDVIIDETGYTGRKILDKYDIWQYTSSGKVNGISGNVDMNYCYTDFVKATQPTEPSVNIQKPTSTPVSKPTNTPAYKPGQAIKLNQAPLYATSVTSKASTKKNGTFYIWSSEVINKRIRITNAASKAGKSGQVTGWIDVSSINITSTATTTKPNSTTKPTAQPTSKTYKKGALVKLTNKPLYTSSTSKKAVTKKSGNYYIYDGKKVNGRYRITNKANRCGKTPAFLYVTGWVEL